MMKINILIISMFCALIMTIGTMPRASALDVSAKAAILVDAGSGRVLYSKNCDLKMLFASTTKIMTALVAIENSDIKDIVTVKKEYTLAEGSSMYLKEGEKLTLETLLYGLMLQSGNDAALAVADYCGGSVSKFVKLMNEKADELGMNHTSFENPSGLDGEEHYSTAADLAKLAAAAMDVDTFAKIASTKSVTIGGRTMYNHNKMLSSCNGVIGLKTGYTRAAGRSLVCCAVRDGQRLITVTLNDPNDWADHAALFDYGFENYKMQRLNGTTEELYRISVTGGTSDTVGICAETAIRYPVGIGETVTTEVKLAASVKAEVRLGSLAGKLIYYVNGNKIAETYLLYNERVAKEQIRINPLERIKNFFGIVTGNFGGNENSLVRASISPDLRASFVISNK